MRLPAAPMRPLPVPLSPRSALCQPLAHARRSRSRLPPLSREALAAVAKEPGAPTEELARAVDELFTAEGLGETRAVVVMHGGKIAAERYAPGYGPETRFVSWSMAKTVTAVMIGMLVADGRLHLDENAAGAALAAAGRSARRDHAAPAAADAQRACGTPKSGEVPYESGEVRMLFLDGRDDMAGFAESQPLEAEPGAKFEYSSNTTVILADIAARVLTREAATPRRGARRWPTTCRAACAGRSG